MDSQEFMDAIRSLSPEEIEQLSSLLALPSWATQRAGLRDTGDHVRFRILANGSAVTTDSTGDIVDLTGKSLGDTLNFVGPTVKVHSDNRRQFDITMSATGGQLCYDVFLSEDGSAVYPSTQDPPNIFSTMQAAADYAAALEALGAISIRFWVCPSTTSYGNATVVNGDHVWYIDASANDTGMGSGVPYLSDSIIGDLDFGDVNQVAIAIDLVIRNTRMGALTVAPGAGEMFLWLDLNNSIVSTIAKGIGSGNLHLQSANWIRGAVGTIDVDSFQGCRFVQSTTGLITVADMHVAEFSECHVDGMDIINTFQNLTIVGGKNGFGATGNSFVHMNLANVSHPTISGNNRGLVVDANNCDAISATRTLVNNAGAVTIKGACIVGNTIPVNGGTAIFATGAFQDGTFGPNSPDNADYSGVTGTNNHFYTSGTIPVGGSSAAANNEPYVVYAPPANLPLARQYINVATAFPATATTPDGAFYWDANANALYINDQGNLLWKMPMAFRVYTSLGEEPAVGHSF